MITEYDNVRNPMLGAYILWNFTLGYFSQNSESVPTELLFIVLPIIFRKDLYRQIKCTNSSSGLKILIDKCMDKKVLLNDEVSNIHNDINRMKELTLNSIGEAIKVGLISIDPTTNTTFPLVLRRHLGETQSIVDMGKNSEKLGKWCSSMSLSEIENVLKVRF